MVVITARDIMNLAVVRLERGHTISEAAKTMAEKRVGCVIVTAGDYPVGILTETDIVRVVANSGDVNTTKIESAMSSPLFSVAPDGDLMVIAATMSSNHIKKMPVIERQQVVGIITQTDVVKYAMRSIEDIQHDYTEGKMSEAEYSRLTAQLFSSVPRIPDAMKQWHMRCRSCNFRFLAEEQKDGSLTIQQCPRCSGAITYDLTPPL